MHSSRTFAIATLICCASLSAAAEEVIEEVVVIAKRQAEFSPTGGGGLGFTPQNGGRIDTGSRFGGGGGTRPARAVNVERIEGAIKVSFANLNFTIEIPADVVKALGTKKLGVLLTALTNYQSSPTLFLAFTHMSNQLVGNIVIHYGNMVISTNGTMRSFKTGEFGAVSYDGSDTVIVAGSTVHVSINEGLTRGNDNEATRSFALTAVHELLHPFEPGTDASEEARVQGLADRVYRDLYARSGVDELAGPAQPEMAAGMIIRGTDANDALVGGWHDDMLYGGFGNDVLRGEARNDHLFGESGDDALYGGAGDNWLEGGSGNDTYDATGGGNDVILDEAGSDRLVALDVSATRESVRRQGDTLFISGNGRVIQVDGQWRTESRIDNFSFANGTFTALQITQLITPPSRNCFRNGRPVLCTPDGEGER